MNILQKELIKKITEASKEINNSTYSSANYIICSVETAEYLELQQRRFERKEKLAYILQNI